ncbi:hypothetical protein SDC9_187815 [bioreactor metagenome]|uniref:Bacteriophage T5 Orf172 DNA-binding domain-containing protein n=1 Tax=bioreactor metagenome TaxID=1076179 RepID=A0A645HPW5_9ZZZZ
MIWIEYISRSLLENKVDSIILSKYSNPPEWLRHDYKIKDKNNNTCKKIWIEFVKSNPPEWMEKKTKIIISSPYEYCYIIQCQQHFETNIYKIGRSNNILQRMNSSEYYERRIIIIREVKNSIECEKEIKQIFKSKFGTVRGSEYFDGNIKEIIEIFNLVCNSYI